MLKNVTFETFREKAAIEAIWPVNKKEKLFRLFSQPVTDIFFLFGVCVYRINQSRWTPLMTLLNTDEVNKVNLPLDCVKFFNSI